MSSPVPAGWEFPPAIAKECTLPVVSTDDLATLVNTTSSKKKGKSPKAFIPLAHPLPGRVVPGDALRRLGVLSTARGLEPEAFRLTSEWAAVRYFWALDDNPLAITAPARQLRYHHRAASSEHLGIALGLEVAYRYLKAMEPTATVRFVDADFALDLKRIATLAGDVRVSKVEQNTPDYFAVVTKGFAAQILAVEVKGTHRNGHHLQQLADAARQVTGVSIEGAIPDSLAFATVLLGPAAGIQVYALDPRGQGDWIAIERAEDRWRVPEWDERALRVHVPDAPVFAGRLVDAEAHQLIAYASGEDEPDNAPTAHPPSVLELDHARYLGRSMTFDDGRVRIQVFRGVEEATWFSVTSRDAAERVEGREAAEGRFTRETLYQERRVTSFGEDGTVLDLRVDTSR